MQAQTYNAPAAQVQTQVAPFEFKLSDHTNFKQAEIELIKQTVAKGLTDLELAYFLKISHSVDLNPLTKEIWAYKVGGTLLTFAGRDGFRSVAHRNKNFLSLNSMEVCSNDSFGLGVTQDGEMFVNHQFGISNRGTIVGAYAIVKLKNKEKVVEYADFATYNKGQSAWNTHKAEMIKKVAEVHALKKTCNIRGIYAEEEFGMENGKLKFQVMETANGNAETLKPKALPAMITKAQIKKIKELLPKKGKIEANLLKRYEKKKLEDFSSQGAKNIIIMLEKVPDATSKAVEGTVIKSKQKPKKEKGKLTLAMDKIKKKKEEEAEFVGLDEETCQIINELVAHDPKDLTKEQKQLIDDCNGGKFQGKVAYPSIFNQVKK